MSVATVPPSSLKFPVGEDATTSSEAFDVYTVYQRYLTDENISPPLAAILALTELIETSNAGTMFELVQALNDGAEALKSKSSNPISLSAGCELMIAFVTLIKHDAASFSQLKTELAKQGRKYAQEASTFRDKIADQTLGFIKDDSVILTHSYSRVVMRALLRAHKRKRISVYVTEARPRGLGIKTCEALTAAGIPCTVVLDSAVAYVMDKVDFVLVGSEAVVESGGLINAVGSNQIAIIAKAARKPFYALAESYKFHRLFPLGQYDLPTHKKNILSFPPPMQRAHAPLTARPSIMSPSPAVLSLRETAQSNAQRSKLKLAMPSRDPLMMSPEQLARNPDVDYTRPDLISLVFSDVGSLTPEGVTTYLVGMFAG